MKAKKMLRLTLGTSLVLLLTRCAVSIYSDRDSSVNFSNYKTFAWYQKDHKQYNVKNFDNQIIESNVKNYASSELSMRGYVAEIDSPDVLLDYDIAIQKKTDVVSSPVYSSMYNYNSYNPYGNRYFNGNYNYNNFRYNNYGYMNNRYNNYNNMGYNGYGYNGYSQGSVVTGYRTQSYSYDEGTLTIYLTERKTGRLLWKGWSVGTVTDEQSYESELRSDIHRIFKRFPIKVLKHK